MGKLSTTRQNRAARRAHAKALEKRSRLEAKQAARAARRRTKGARKAGRDVVETVRETAEHAVDLARTQTGHAGEVARAEAADLRKSAGKKAKKLRKAADRNAKKLRKAAEKQTQEVRKARKGAGKDAFALEKKRAGLEAKQAKQEQKIVKAGHKHEKKLAEAELKQIEAGKFGQKDVKRWIDVAKTAAPVLAPLIYKGVISSRGRVEGSHPATSGPGSALEARIRRIGAVIDRLDARRRIDSKDTEFVASARTRLTDMTTAVQAAEELPTSQRREVHASVSKELDRLDRDVLARLGVEHK